MVNMTWLAVSSSSWCLGRAAVCDCGTPRTFLLPFFCIAPDKKAIKINAFLPCSGYTLQAPGWVSTSGKKTFFLNKMAYVEQ